MKKIIPVLISIFILSLIISITESKENILKSKNELTANDTVCFKRDILPLFLSNCGNSGCHDATSHRGGITISNYDDIRSGVTPNLPDFSDFYNVLLRTGEDVMPPPPRGPFSSAQIDLVRRWILQGALNNDCPTSGCDTTNVSYDSTIKPIITNACIGCHNKSGASGGVDLTKDSTVNNLKAAIYGSMAHLSGFKPMPPGMGVIDSCYVMQVKKWANINTGGPCDTTNITYTGTIKPILQLYCFSCHSGPSPTGGIDFSNDSTAKAWKVRILIDIDHLPTSDPMPKGQPKIQDTCAIAKIRAWNNITDVFESINFNSDLKVTANYSLNYLNVEYRVKQAGPVFCELYDRTGRKLVSSSFGYKDRGYYQTFITNENLTMTGVYFLRLRIGNELLQKKFMFIK